MNIFLTDEVDTSTNYNRFISVNSAADNHVVYIFTPYVFINFHVRCVYLNNHISCPLINLLWVYIIVWINVEIVLQIHVHHLLS